MGLTVATQPPDSRYDHQAASSLANVGVVVAFAAAFSLLLLLLLLLVLLLLLLLFSEQQ